MLHRKFLSLAAASLALLASSVMAQELPEDHLPTFDRDVARALHPHDECIPQPIRTEAAVPIFAEEKWIYVELTAPNGEINYVDIFALNDAVPLAYADAVNCSYSFGSIREVNNCTTILTGIRFQRTGVLVKCLEYTSNSLDGATFTTTVDNYENATAIGTIAPCLCYAPYNVTFNNTLNDRYESMTDFQGSAVTILSANEVEVIPDCPPSSLITYNSTTVCLPSVPPPPLVHPTRNPTPHPTPKPTRKPTSKPTRKPTPKPTRKPTRKPTPHPTRTPTICQEVCNTRYYSKLCHWLEETGLCTILNNRAATFTLFAPYDGIWDIGPQSTSEMKRILSTHIHNGVARTPDSFVCDRTYPTRGVSTTTRCKNVDPDRKLYTDTITVKCQVGPGNVKKGNCPEMHPVFVTTANGYIIEVDDVILPGPRSPTKRPTPRPTPIPTRRPNYTGRPATANPHNKPIPAPTRRPDYTGRPHTGKPQNMDRPTPQPTRRPDRASF